jgi:hypothetical protein
VDGASVLGAVRYRTRFRRIIGHALIETTSKYYSTVRLKSPRPARRPRGMRRADSSYLPTRLSLVKAFALAALPSDLVIEEDRSSVQDSLETTVSQRPVSEAESATEMHKRGAFGGAFRKKPMS